MDRSASAYFSVQIVFVFPHRSLSTESDSELLEQVAIERESVDSDTLGSEKGYCDDGSGEMVFSNVRSSASETRRSMRSFGGFPGRFTRSKAS